MFNVISERKRAHEELKRLSDRLLLATSSARLGIWDWDVKNNVMIWDDRMLELYGLTKDTFPGGVQAWQGGLHPDDRDRAIEECQLALRGEKDWDTEFRVVHATGRILHIKAAGIVLRDADGNPERMLGVNGDITERIRAEAEVVAAKAAKEIAENRTKFLDIAAHELRNPLAGMSLLLQVVEKQLANGQTVEASTVARLREPVDRLTRLVADLVDVARLERGHLQLRLVRGDMSTWIQRWSEALQLHAPGRQIVFLFPSARSEIELDADRINQVLTNLLENAVRHTPSSTPIEIRVEPLPTGVRVSLRDQGSGIAEDMLERIFEPFSMGRFDENEESSHAGLGLGLSICREIVELHGGKIGAHSQIGAGSTFYFDLPWRVPQRGNGA